MRYRNSYTPASLHFLSLGVLFLVTLFLFGLLEYGCRHLLRISNADYLHDTFGDDAPLMRRRIPRINPNAVSLDLFGAYPKRQATNVISTPGGGATVTEAPTPGAHSQTSAPLTDTTPPPKPILPPSNFLRTTVAPPPGAFEVLSDTAVTTPPTTQVRHSSDFIKTTLAPPPSAFEVLSITSTNGPPQSFAPTAAQSAYFQSNMKPKPAVGTAGNEPEVTSGPGAAPPTAFEQTVATDDSRSRSEFTGPNGGTYNSCSHADKRRWVSDRRSDCQCSD